MLLACISTKQQTWDRKNNRAEIKIIICGFKVSSSLLRFNCDPRFTDCHFVLALHPDLVRVLVH